MYPVLCLLISYRSAQTSKKWFDDMHVNMFCLCDSCQELDDERVNLKSQGEAVSLA